MRETPNLLLKLPDPTDYVLVEDLNENFAKLDTEIAKITDEETGVEAQLAKHLDEISGKHIHSSGSNANGYWIKFDDGTQLCCGAIDGTTNEFGRVAKNYPASFIGIPRNFLSNAHNFGITNVPSTSNTGFDVTLVDYDGNLKTDITFSASYFTIGWWK